MGPFRHAAARVHIRREAEGRSGPRRRRRPGGRIGQRDGLGWGDGLELGGGRIGHPLGRPSTADARGGGCLRGGQKAGEVAVGPGSSVAVRTPDDRLVRAASSARGDDRPRRCHHPGVAFRVARFFLGRGARFGPGDHAPHLRTDVVLHALAVTQGGTVDRNRSEHLQNAVDQQPAAAAGVKRIDRVQHIGLFETDEMLHQLQIGKPVLQRVHVAGLVIRQGFATRLGQQFGLRRRLSHRKGRLEARDDGR